MHAQAHIGGVVLLLWRRLVSRGWRSVVARASLIGVAWWGISEGDVSALVVGPWVMLLAFAASLLVAPASRPRWSVFGLLRLAAAFVTGSLRGGVDVARRALTRRLPLAPALVRYRLSLRGDAGRHLFVAALNLMPGTLSVQVTGDTLEVHVLVDSGEALARQLRGLELHVSRATGEPPEDPHG
jgi:multicomponent Na+:H+ antiporter subunit E